MDSNHENLAGYVIGLTGLLIFMLPSYIAFRRGHARRWMILGLNIFLGGTGIVWLIALIWAMQKPHDAATFSAGTNGPVPLVSDESERSLSTRDLNNLASEMSSHEALSAPRSPEPILSKDSRSKLERLTTLRDEGMLSEKEFEAQKSLLHSLSEMP